MKDEEKQTVASPIEPVVSGELVQAEYDGYSAYHKYATHEDNPYEGEKGERWALGFRKARNY